MANLRNEEIKVKAQPDARFAISTLCLSQNENGRLLEIEIQDLDIPAGSLATFVGTKPDGMLYSTTGTIEDNVVSVQEDSQMTAAAGEWDARINIVNGGNTLGTARIRMLIIPDTAGAGAIPSDSVLDGVVAECRAYAYAAVNSAYYGSPLVASTAAAMTDEDKVYVYTGSETGYTAGNWYYYDGTSWVSGGVYNSVAVQTDTTLAVYGMPADARATGQAIGSMTSRISTLEETVEGIGDGQSSITWRSLLDQNVNIISGTANYGLVGGYTYPFAAGETYRVTWNGVSYTFDTRPDITDRFTSYDGYYVGDPDGIAAPVLIYRYNETQLLVATTDAPGTKALKIEKKIVTPIHTGGSSIWNETKVCFFGDSVGYGFNNNAHSFVDIIGEAFFFASVHKNCVSGSTTPTLHGRMIESATELASADIIYCEYQYNDVIGMSNGNLSTAQLVQAVRTAMNYLRGINATALVVWMPLTVYHFDKIGGQQYAALFKEWANAMYPVFAELGISLLPIYDMGLAGHLSNDGKHPNDSGHQMISKLVMQLPLGATNYPTSV